MDKPFISSDQNLPELTVGPIILGVLLGIVFGASSLYLALKVGMTVSASIPVAVLSITLFRGLSKVFGIRRATILENNIVQTTGSAGESIAFGVAVTMPALLILGYEMDLTRIMMVAVLGALLGVLMMIPLRNALIVKGHKELIYPEGTACAEVLIIGEKGGTSAKIVFTGFFVGLGYKILNVGMKLWNDVPSKSLGFFKGAAVSAEVSPELLGVGYIIGPRISCIMVAGGILSSWVLTPMIKLFGENLTAPLFPATQLISQMSLHDIWKNYVLYIGAGAVATGGIISLFRSLPMIVKSAVAGLGSFKAAGVSVIQNDRLHRDIPMKYVLIGIFGLICAIWFTPILKMNLFGAILIVTFGFLFVTVSSRLTGEIGSSSNPISGMTVATLLITSLIFLSLGWVGPIYRVTALSVAAIVCVAASNAGTTSQDLKTGYLIGATPRAQQIALLIGALTSALVIGYTLELLNNASTVYSMKNVPAGIHVENVSLLTETQKLSGPEGEKDPGRYHILRLPQKQETGPLAQLQSGKYLVGDDGVVKYLVDPGINGVLKTRDDGTSVVKYDAPKARLMSLIIDGILTQKLPWGLVLLGVSIAFVLELCGVSSLPFAVGVYLPLSSSMPIFVGGMMRYMTAAVEESESSPGILFSSGLIAGGAISGIVLAILLVKQGLGDALDFSGTFPAMSGSDLTSVVAFAVLCCCLVAVSRKSTS
jgi:putative OPT family oligopeptide transporter